MTCGPLLECPAISPYQQSWGFAQEHRASLRCRYIRQGRAIFREIFGEMPTGGFVVKIDTEGYEQTIIREIAAAMPPDARIAVVFENLQAGVRRGRHSCRR
jgi:hypothetical protein